MIKVLVNGEEFNGFTDVSVTGAVDQLCNQLTAKCAADDTQAAFPVLLNSIIQFWVGDTQLMEGEAEINKGSYSSADYAISIDARDKTKQILKNDLPPDFVIKGPIQLKDVMEKTLEAVGIDFTIVDDTDGLEEFSSKELLTDDVGSSIWDFWLSLAEKRKVLISKNSDGEIVIRNPNTLSYDTTLQSRISDPDRQNNILSASWEFNNTERRHEYRVISQANVSAPRDESAPTDGEYWEPTDEQPDPPTSPNAEAIETLQEQLIITEPGSEVARVIEEQIRLLSGADETPSQIKSSRVQTRGIAIDPAIPLGSVCYETAEHPSDDDECERLAQWQCNKARAESVSYSCEVEQLEIDGKPWQEGYLIPVIDEIAGIDSVMLIKSVKYQTSVNENGDASETVQLTMTLPDAYGQDAVPTDSQIQTGVVGAKWAGEFQ